MGNLSRPHIRLAIPALAAAIALPFQPSAGLTLTAKVRDFREVVDGSDFSHPATHPDFGNASFQDCGVGPGPAPVAGYVQSFIDTTGSRDADFHFDHRSPSLARFTRPSDGKTCFTGLTRFKEWFNDKPGVNRPFYLDLELTAIPGGHQYEYADASFFPLDSGNVSNLKPVLSAPDNLPYGHLQSAAPQHNYGFTTEIHSRFTFLRGKGQVFNFAGDDDIWVFINGRLVADMGGVHPAMSKSVNLDTVGAGAGDLLVDGMPYHLDFFLAERSTPGSSIRISTNIELSTPDPAKVGTPIITPAGVSFKTSISVTLATVTPGAVIHYTLNGSIPHSASPVYAGPISVIGTTTLRAMARKAGWVDSDVMTATYVKTFVPSSVEILDAQGGALPGGALTELATAYTVRLKTTQAGLGGRYLTAATRATGDTVFFKLDAPEVRADHFLYSFKVPFSIGTRTINESTEAAAEDSIKVRWVNPYDFNDVAMQAVAVRPSATVSVRAAHPDAIRAYGAGRIASAAWLANPPRSIATFDALGVFAGWARPAGEAGQWLLPATGRFLEIRWPDGTIHHARRP